jgi:hypothetical protein
MVCGSYARAWLGVNGLQPHLLHQALHTLMVDLQAEAPYMSRHPRPTVKRRLGVWLIDATHQLSVDLRCRRWRVIERGTVQPDQLALTADADVQMAELDHRAFGLN